MKKPLRSRKFWLTVLGAIFAAVATPLGIPGPAVKLVVMLLGGYVATEGIVDAASALRSRKGETDGDILHSK